MSLFYTSRDHFDNSAYHRTRYQRVHKKEDKLHAKTHRSFQWTNLLLQKNEKRQFLQQAGNQRLIKTEQEMAFKVERLFITKDPLLSHQSYQNFTRFGIHRLSIKLLSSFDKAAIAKQRIYQDVSAGINMTFRELIQPKQRTNFSPKNHDNRHMPLIGAFSKSTY